MPKSECGAYHSEHGPCSTDAGEVLWFGSGHLISSSVAVQLKTEHEKPSPPSQEVFISIGRALIASGFLCQHFEFDEPKPDGVYVQARLI